MTTETDALRVQLHDLAIKGNPWAASYSYRLETASDIEAEAELVRADMTAKVQQCIDILRPLRPFLRQFYDAAGPN